MATAGSWGSSATSPLDDLLAKATQQEEEAKLANLSRQQQIEAIWDEVIKRYQPGGTFQTEAFRQLGVQKEQDVMREYGSRTQDMISRGLFGTSVAPSQGEIGRKWERDVGAPSRLKLEDLMMQRLSTAQSEKAGFLERIENDYPDYNSIAQLMAQASSAPSGSGWGNRQPLPSLAGETTGFTQAPGSGVASAVASRSGGGTTAGSGSPIQMSPLDPMSEAAARASSASAAQEQNAAAAAATSNTPSNVPPELKAFFPDAPTKMSSSGTPLFQHRGTWYAATPETIKRVREQEEKLYGSKYAASTPSGTPYGFGFSG